MPAIFICYRREDSAGHAGRLRDSLAARLHGCEIFRDLEAIGPGEDFLQVMSREIAACDVFLAVIGNRWLTAAHADGTRRLDDSGDHVRSELVEALARGVRIIPVLVAGAAMPRAGDLPDALKPLATRNAITLDDEGWEFDVERLTGAIDPARHRGGRTVPRDFVGARPRWPSLVKGRRLVAVVAAAVGVVIAGALFLNRSPDPAAAVRPSAGSGPEAVRQQDAALPRSDSGTTRAAAETPASRTTAGEVLATFPMGSEAEVGQAVYEIADAKVVPGAGGSTLELRVRARNDGAYDLLFHAGQFRLVHGEDVHAPAGGLSEAVPSQTAKEAVLSFGPLDAGDAASALRIVQGDETADVPIDLSGRRGRTAAADREARRAGRSTFQARVDPAASTMRFGDVVCELRSATVRRYAHKLTLSLGVRVHNRMRYDVAVGDDHFRLLVDGLPRGPAERFQRLVRGEESGEFDVQFDVPFETQTIALRARFRDQVEELALRIPDGAVPTRTVGRTAGH